MPVWDTADRRGADVLSPDLLCLAGYDGYFKRLSPAWATCLGWALEALQAAPLLDFVHPDDRDATRQQVGALAAGAETALFENRCRCSDGSWRWLQWHAQGAPGRDQFYATVRDVTRLKWLEREILTIADRQRASLGRDLHDGLCQTLAGISALSTTLCRRLAAASDAAHAAAATEIATLLNDAIGQARDLARGLDPVGLRTGGLDAALEHLAADTEHRFRVSCSFACDRPAPGLGQEVKMHLFRIAQEAVHNAVSHAGASRIEIALRRREAMSVLSICDDGAGLGREAPAHDGIGLSTMAWRAGLIGGTLEVTPRAPHGTAVVCVFPASPALDTPDPSDDVRADT